LEFGAVISGQLVPVNRATPVQENKLTRKPEGFGIEFSGGIGEKIRQRNAAAVGSRSLKFSRREISGRLAL
jgi:hypothetical protein